MSVMPSLRAARERALPVLFRTSFIGPLIARVTLGVLFVSTGWGKANNLPQVAGFFTELQIPAPGFHATLVSYVELIGGLLLLVGLVARAAAIPLIVSMAVAIIAARAEEVHGLADLFGLVEWTYAALLAWIVIHGPGNASLDHFRFGTKKPKAKSDVTRSTSERHATSLSRSL